MLPDNGLKLGLLCLHEEKFASRKFQALVVAYFVQADSVMRMVAVIQCVAGCHGYMLSVHTL